MRRFSHLTIKSIALLLYCSIALLLFVPSAQAQFFGVVDNPLTKVSNNSYGDVVGTGGTGGGLIGFISNIVKLITIVVGLFAMFNFIIAGVDYITSQGDPKGTESARSKMKNSVIGIIIIVGTLTLTSLVSKVFFGRYDAILKPTIYGPGSV